MTFIIINTLSQQTQMPILSSLVFLHTSYSKGHFYKMNDKYLLELELIGSSLGFEGELMWGSGLRGPDIR